MFEIISPIFIYPNKHDLLIAFLNLHIIAFFAGYPLVFQILSTLSNTGSKRRLTENFLASKSTICLKRLSFIGIIVTGLTLLIFEIEYFNTCNILFFIPVLIFFVVVFTFLLYINNALNHVYHHDKIIKKLKFNIFLKSNNFKTLKSSLNPIRKIFKPSHSKILKKANKYRTELAILHELILDYSSRIGYEEFINKLCRKLFYALNRENLYELSKTEHANISIINFYGKNSLLSSITKNTFTNIQQSYNSASKINNQSTIDQIDSLLNSLLVEHSRHIGSEVYPKKTSLLYIMSEEMVIEILEFYLNDIKSNYFYSKLPLYTYNNILFQRHERSFEILMIPLFDEFLVNIGKTIIDNGNETLCKNFIGYLYDGPRFDPRISKVYTDMSGKVLEDSISKKTNTALQYFEEIDSLKDNTAKIYTINEFEDFVNQLQNILAKLCSGETLQSYYSDIRYDAEEWLKLNHLRECLFDMCAWCLRENKLDFIRILWEYHQPSDSTALYGENTLLPSDLKSLLYHCFLVRRPHDRDLDFNWPGHHGKGGWFRKYLIVHFCAVFDNKLQDKYQANEGDNDREIVIKNILDKVKNTEKAYSLTLDCDELIRTANGMVKDENILIDLGFDISENNPIKRNVIPLLEYLQSSANDKIKEILGSAEINKELVNIFFERIQIGFMSRLDILHIINNNSSTIEDFVKVSNNTYYDDWIPKDYFIKDHYIDCSSVGPEYGEELARLIEYQIFYMLTRKASTTTYQDFVNNHVQKHNDWVLISAPNAIGYKSTWRNEFDIIVDRHDSDSKTKYEHGYRGKIELGNSSIHLYSIKYQPMYPFPEDSTILIPFSRLGKIKISPKEQKYNDDIKFSFNSNEILSESEISMRLHEPADSKEKNIKRLYLTISAEFEWSFSNDSKAGNIWLVSP